MDEILSKLRNRNKREQNEKNEVKESVKSNTKGKTSDKKDMDNLFSENELLSDDLLSMDNIDLSEGEFREPTSSQCQSPFQIMKLDFDRLRSTKKEGSYVNVSYVAESKGYKIHCKFISLVKKIHRFNNEVASLELVDESGSIYGSGLLTTIKEKNIKIGSILVLSEFSLWRLDTNHINIVSSNILEVL